MSLLFESIRIEDGVPQHLEWHERRMNRSIMEVWGSSINVKLADLVVVPPEHIHGLVKCNIRYGPEIREIIFQFYKKRIIRSLRLIECDTIDYHLKYLDRGGLNALFHLRNGCDEIIIVNEGFLTDTSVSNIIFHDGKKWVTPARPLLRGTCCERLIEEGFLTEQDIMAGDIGKFTGCKLINAMRDPGEQELIPVSAILEQGSPMMD